MMQNKRIVEILQLYIFIMFYVESEERAIITNHFFPIFLIFERFDVPELYA